MEVRKFKPKHGVQWISCGWRLVKKRLSTWILASTVLTFAALFLGLIPVIGAVTTAFMFPIILCSSIIVVDRFNNPDAPRPANTGKRTRGMMANIRYTKDMLIAAFGKDHRILGMLGLAAGMMVLGIVIEIVMRIVSGGVVTNPAHFWELSGGQFVSLLTAHAVAYTIYLVMGMCFFFAIPLFILRDYDIGAAIKLSLKASFTNLVPFVAYAATMAIPMIIGSIALSIDALIGFGVMLVFGSITWMLFINSMYCCYRLTFK